MDTFPPQLEAYRSTTLNPPEMGAERRDGVREVVPVVSGPAGFLRWLMGRQWLLILGNTLLNLGWYLPGALNPWLLGRAIDTGVRTGDVGATAGWAVLMLVTVLFGAVLGIVGHTLGVSSWLNAMYTTIQLVARKVLQLGHVLPRRAPTGEVLSVASSDSDSFGALTEVVGRAVAAVVAFAFVSALVLSESVRLGLVVLVAAPLLVGVAAPVMRPLQRAQAVERSRSSKLTGMATDIVAGLRILRGIGGERTFGDNYAVQSQQVRVAGVRSGFWQAVVQALSSLLSGALLVLLTWLGVGDLLAGQLTIGQLISFFGYAIFLTNPMQTIFEFVLKWTAGLVAARKTITVLATRPPWSRPTTPRSLPVGADIVDAASGLVVRPGRLTVVAGAVPDDSAALADRLGRYLPPSEAVPLALEEGLKGWRARREHARRDEQRLRQARADEELAGGRWSVTVGGVDLADVPLAQVREHIMVCDTGALVFAGTLQALIDPTGSHTREQAEQAVRVASAEDVIDQLPGGWQGLLDERGRGLSGGQRQRVVLARALLADPEVLVLVDPTSAVDAHTEARIAERLADHRRGRTTVITSVSPLLLYHADEVALLVDGRVAATGTHHELAAGSAAYRAVVARGTETDR